MCRTTTTAESTNQPSSKESKNKNDSIPWMLRGWLFISRAVPSFTIGGLDFGLTLASCVFLYGVKLAIIQMLVWTQWFPNDLAAAEKGSTFLVPIVHSVNLVLGLAACFLSHKYKPSAKFSVAPQWWQEAVHALLQFCTGYMLYDTIFSMLLPHNFAVQGDDVMFLIHHIITTLYMTSTRILGAGHQSAMICMFLGELTNPFHNLWYFFDHCMSDNHAAPAWMPTAEYINTFLFTSTYVAIRSVIGPLFLFHASYDLWKHGQKAGIPLMVVLLWCTLMWAVEYGSIPWIEECATIFMDKYSSIGRGLFAKTEL